ncbi:DUF1659 domain-containing protein [Neobacillus sp. PS3-12]|jgi:hypothetical protein|uniref:DUF1659 domain-containing protein n=1 Tax=Neobacillus sp. PS3-12 TaxID=3070677 RepID=UPI0027E1BE74|nr:DUF1659 domain-containing protein [Neobacillus sp. PS3-12]WML54859.1 DUF1659 domain-containing protein [Neobacillus sp. PS3-12]
MAAANLYETKLRMTFETGMDEKGKPIYKAKTLNNIKKEATTDQLFQVAQALSALSNDSLFKIDRNDTTDITA